MFSRIKIYTVHLKPDAQDEIERLRFVSEGFNFYGFVYFFNLFWALKNRLWRFAAIIFIGNTLISFITQELNLLNLATSYVCSIGFQLWCGFAANDFWRAQLRRQGYITYALVSGENELRAEQRFFDQHAGQLAA